jgi:hypothetical protein
VPEGLVHHFGNLLHARDSVVPLGDGVEDLELLLDLMQLAAALAEGSARDLPRDQKYRRRGGVGRAQTSGGVESAGAGR